MAGEDPYAVLGVRPDAGLTEITAAYRALVRRFHPDTPRAAEPECLAAVIAAYRILRDPVRRAEYDRRRGVTRGGVTGRGVSVPVRVHRPRDHPAPEPELRAGPVRRHRP
ncbi:J domain-containing protein [Amycolatopsis cynarae]|uniref:J domain-containing protein n=1 Tax=Amycolatopsis cynarae TaxID=2995223 RepID=A0ABY7BBN1_9PSEU|nr:J domain-containing protein [Amycolatopsis sp. HUAS 11-8]WAL68063.1 J domain-containing protein [Amycolatopsis sp. HUAS 11-8]